MKSAMWPDTPPGRSLVEKGYVDVSAKTHGWITFGADGAYAYPDSGDVIDAKTKKTLTRVRDADGNPVMSSKFIEIHFRGKDAVRVGLAWGAAALRVASEIARVTCRLSNHSAHRLHEENFWSAVSGVALVAGTLMKKRRLCLRVGPHELRLLLTPSHRAVLWRRHRQLC